MNEQVIVRNVRAYKETLVKEGLTAKKVDENTFAEHLTDREKKEHAIWVCDQIIHFVEQNQRDLAIMWYGFLQAMMWLEDEYTIEELRQDNVPSAPE
jgi:hypothetical protein